MAEQPKKVTPASAVNPRGAENKDPLDRNPHENELKDNKNLTPEEMAAARAKSDEGMAQAQGNAAVRAKAEQDEQEQFVTGFTFDLAQLSDIYGNLRDGNYWSAFKMSIEVLHNAINSDSRTLRGTPSMRVNARMAQRAQGAVRLSEVENIEKKLTECCDEMKRQHSTAMSRNDVGKSQEKNVDAIDPFTIIAIVQSIIELVRKFRQSRQ